MLRISNEVIPAKAGIQNILPRVNEHLPTLQTSFYALFFYVPRQPSSANFVGANQVSANIKGAFLELGWPCIDIFEILAEYIMMWNAREPRTWQFAVRSSHVCHFHS